MCQKDAMSWSARRYKRNRIDDLTLPVGSAEIVGLAEGLFVG